MEHPQDDILKNLLQEVFSDYQPEPQAKTWDNIRAAIQPTSSPKTWAIFTRKWLLVGGILLIGAIGMWLPNVTETTHQTALVTNEISTPKIVKYGIEKFTCKKYSGLPNNPLKAMLTTKLATNNGELTSVKKIIAIEKTVKLIDEKLSNNRLFEQKIMSSIPNLVQQENTGAIKKTSTLSIDYDKSMANNTKAESLNQESTAMPQIMPTTETIEHIKHSLPLNTLLAKPININSATPISLPALKEMEGAKKILRRSTFIQFSLTPLNTYRMLQINRSGVQNIKTNSLFDNQRNGISVDFGITKQLAHHWSVRTNLTYLRMQQWINFEVANTNEYLVYNTVANKVEPVAASTTQHEVINMVGAGVNLQKYFKRVEKNRYFLSTGIQLMYNTTEKQANSLVNTSAGFEHIINNNCFVTIEPTASFFMNGTNDSQGLIHTKWYNVGVKIGMSYRIK